MINGKLRIKIVKRLLLVAPIQIVLTPISFLWYGVVNTMPPWIDALMDWAIDAPITAYEKANGLVPGSLTL